jgi:hypothetical protein
VITLEDLSEPAPEPGPADWNDEGVVILESVLDDALIVDYQRAWMRVNGYDTIKHGRIVADRPGGWPVLTPYMDVPELLALVTCEPIAVAVERLLGEPGAANLCLTGWTSTTRNWHQDTYLNQPLVGDSYAAVWFALDDVNADMGPFQYLPGSHRWHRLTMAKMLEALGEDGSRHDWPWRSEALLTPLVEERIKHGDAEVTEWLPGRGDVLIWHPRLYHRGSPPAFVNAYRPALICHYSGISSRPDFPEPVQAEGGGWYYPFDYDTPAS